MIFNRHIYTYLKDWKTASYRKPLVLRGARQVGKTTVVKQFAKEYKHFVFLNLEKAEDIYCFEKFNDAKLIAEALLYAKGIPLDDMPETLLFIDEIQESPKAIHLLRYFYEDVPSLHVITAGSLLEFALRRVSSIPVGRIIYMYMYPLNFSEYLDAIGHKMALEQLNIIPPKVFAFDLLIKLFNRFIITGGLPEVVSADIKSRNIATLPVVYESIWETYVDDVEKYAANETERNVIIHLMRAAPSKIDQRVKFERFGGSDYRSREVKEAFLKLEKAKFIRLIHPSTDVHFPALPHSRKNPRLQFLDTGLLNHALGIQADLLGIKDLSNSYKGAVVPHIITQELLSRSVLKNSKPNFWVRDKSQSLAEVDLLHAYRSKVIPIEIKSGPKGTLKSLHIFIDMCDHEYAVRIYAGDFQIEKSRTPAGKDYLLMNMPYYLACLIPEYIAYFVDNYSINSIKDAKVFKEYKASNTTMYFSESDPLYYKGKPIRESISDSFGDFLNDTISDNDTIKGGDTIKRDDTINYYNLSPKKSDTINDIISAGLVGIKNEVVKSRLKSIIIYINNYPGPKVKDIAQYFKVSEITTKRDLAKLSHVIQYRGAKKKWRVLFER